MTKIGLNIIEMWAWISDYSHKKQLGAKNNPCFIFDAGLLQLSLKIGMDKYHIP